VRSGWLIAWAVVLGCAGAPPHVIAPPFDPARAELVARLCAPLPTHAYDCVVGWPASIAPARREAVATVSEGEVWVRGPGVRAFATCSDRPAEDGPVAQVIVLLVDTAVATPESVAEGLPRHVRWTDACEDETDGCASYYAQADGDRVVLTRRVQRPIATDLDVAHLACAAVADGAEEARAMLESDDALVRELHVSVDSLSIVSRRPGGRLGVETVRRTWTELALEVRDDEVEHEADMRSASMGAPIDPERVDVTNETALDLQIQARSRHIARDPSPEAYRALARLAQRGFEAHPSRPDLAVVAVRSAIQSHEIEAARTVLAAFTATVGGEDARVGELGVMLDVASGDAASLGARIATRAPELDAATATHVAETLIAQIAAHPVDPSIPFPMLYAAVITAARAAHVSMVARPSGMVAPAGGAPWAIVAASGGAPVTTVAMCGENELPTTIDAHASVVGTMTAFAMLDHCAAFVHGAPARFELGTLGAGLAAVARGETRFFVEVDGALVGIGGNVDGSRLHVTRATRGLVRSDLARIEREIVAPLDALGTRTFPPPTLVVPLAAARREAARSATTGIEGVDCEATSSGLSCSLESYEPVERLGDAAYAIFAAH
jgi:hypothetical protein